MVQVTVFTKNGLGQIFDRFFSQTHLVTLDVGWRLKLKDTLIVFVFVYFLIIHLLSATLPPHESDFFLAE
jgi:hypothetical protein